MSADDTIDIVLAAASGELTQKEIGDLAGITQGRVSQIMTRYGIKRQHGRRRSRSLTLSRPAPVPISHADRPTRKGIAAARAKDRMIFEIEQATKQATKLYESMRQRRNQWRSLVIAIFACIPDHPLLGEWRHRAGRIESRRGEL